MQTDTLLPKPALQTNQLAVTPNSLVLLLLQ
jgi:hypothetical protein